MLGKDRFLEKISFILFVFFVFLFSKTLLAQNTNNDILIYNKQLKNSSSLFIQSDNDTIEEGEIFFGKDRVRLDYSNPSKITLTLTKKRGMYLNHDLEEARFFNTSESIVSMFYKIFMNEDFFFWKKYFCERKLYFDSRWVNGG